MKSPVIFRASFHQPKRGPLNPSGMKLPGTVEVEVYNTKVGPPPEWKVRRPGTRNEFPVTPQSRASTMQGQVALQFVSQVGEWQAFDASCTPPAALLADEWATDSNGKVYITEIRRERVKAQAAKSGTRLGPPVEGSLF